MYPGLKLLESAAGMLEVPESGSCCELDKMADDEFLDLRTGRAILLKLFDEDYRERGSLNLDRLDGAGSAVFSCISLISYRPVSESASGAVLVISGRAKFAEPIKSFPDSLS